MKIAQIAPIEESVPPKKYGGTELIVSNLTDELIKRGHEVFLFASGDSKTKAKLVPLCPKSIRVLTDDRGQEKIREVWKYLAITKLLKEIGKYKFDIVHQHFGWRVTPFEGFFSAPVVATCHGPLSPDYIKLVYGQNPRNNYITISNAQKASMPKLNFAGTVYNGIDLDNFSFKKIPSGDYYAFLARMSPEKGPKQAILAAKKAGVKLKMAAKIDANDRSYYENEIRPLIDGKQIEYIGEIGLKERDEFLGNAKALLALIQWEEPFGLFFVEAMATGAPVIAVKRGSAPEIIKNGITGYLVDKENDVSQAAEAIHRINSMPGYQYAEMRELCRSRVEENFTVSKMVDGYERIYREIITKQKKH